MKKTLKINLLLIPTIVFPYAFIIVVGLYFFSQYISDNFEKFVHSNLGIFGIGLLVLFLASVTLNIIYIILSKKVTANSILKAALIVKCVHIPTYILIFLFGILLGLMFFMTFPLILFLVFIDFITLILSNFISIYALIKSIREDNLKSNVIPIISIICQFFFCADIISTFVAYLSRKRKCVFQIPIYRTDEW